MPPTGGCDIVIVGVCGAGKSTLAAGLESLGYRARACGQEHSYVPSLWRRRGRPLALIYLEANLDSVCRRLGVRWEESVLEVQRGRLANARENADLVIETDELTVEQVRAVAAAYLAAATT